MNHLKSIFPKIVSTKLIIPGEKNIREESCDNNLNEFTFFSRKVSLPSDDNINEYNFIYIGPKSATLTCLAMRFSESNFYQINPVTKDFEEISMIKNVMRRSCKIEQIKDAKIIGVLMGTFFKENYLDIKDRLRTLIKASGKKTYNIFLKKPNEAKVGNFPQIDVFVYVACPETTIFERSVDPALYKCLVTPWEVEVALNSNTDWSLSFETDYKELLPGGVKYKEFDESTPHEPEVSVSLLTNKTQCIGIG